MKRQIILIFFLIFNLKNLYSSECNTKLTLENVLHSVKNNHPVIRIAMLSNKIANSEVLSSKGAFDINLKSYGFYNRYNSSSDIGQPEYAQMYNTELELLTRYGLLIKSGIDLNKGDIKTPISPTGEDGEYFISLNAPLFRGAGYNTFSVNESLAEYNAKKVKNNLRLVSLELLLKTINTYWKWAASIKKLEIENKLLDLAVFRLKAISKREKNGDLAAIDVVEIKQEIQRRKSRVIKSERTYQKLSYELSWFLWQNNSSETQNILGCSADDFNSNLHNKIKFNLNNGKMMALENRPEIQDFEISRMIAKLEKDFATNDLLPKLDIALKVGTQNGRGSMNGADVKAGLEFDIPLQRRDAKGRVKKFSFELSKINLQEKNMVQKIFLQVDDAISAINQSRKNITIVKEEVNLAEKLENGESKRFSLGDSNLFMVNLRERTSAESKIKLVDIIYEYNLAIAYYKAVTGMLI